MSKDRFIPTVINPNLCHLCGRCLNSCKNNAIIIKGQDRRVDYNKCTGCMTCYNICPYNAITVTSAQEGDTVAVKLDSNSCKVSEGCVECVEHCPARIYSKEGQEIKVVEENIMHCRACKTCEENCPGNSILVVQA